MGDFLVEARNLGFRDGEAAVADVGFDMAFGVEDGDVFAGLAADFDEPAEDPPGSC